MILCTYGSGTFVKRERICSFQTNMEIALLQTPGKSHGFLMLCPCPSFLMHLKPTMVLTSQQPCLYWAVTYYSHTLYALVDTYKKVPATLFYGDIQCKLSQEQPSQLGVCNRQTSCSSTSDIRPFAFSTPTTLGMVLDDPCDLKQGP